MSKKPANTAIDLTDPFWTENVRQPSERKTLKAKLHEAEVAYLVLRFAVLRLIDASDTLHNFTKADEPFPVHALTEYQNALAHVYELVGLPAPDPTE